jgi:phosphoglycerate dehydrogenase-like enzyme
VESEVRRPKVLICDPIAQVGLEMLQEVADVDVKPGLSPEELTAVIGDYEAVVVRSATKIRTNVIERGQRLKVIGRAGAGLDNIDVAEAQQRGIEVVNSPDANTRAVAEHTMGLMLALARHIPSADASLKAGRWDKKKLMGIGLYGKTLGIIGLGRIGREVAARAKAFGMKVLVNQRRPTPELNLELGVEAVDLTELLRASDFVSLHVPARPENHNLIGPKQLALMKPTAYLINTSRGVMVDEQALLDALNDGQIAGAALDVFVKEPAVDSALARHEKVVATPHIAASTEDAQHIAAIMVAQQIVDLLQDRTRKPLPLQVVPLDKVFPHEHTDPRRVSRLAKRFEAEGVLSNPPIVIEADDRYVVLDGASRVTALKELGYPHVIVQVVSDRDKVNLHTWFHAIRDVNPTKLVKLLDDLPEVSMVESDPQKVLDEMFELGGLCYLHTVDDKVYLIRPASGVNHLEALNRLTNTYIGVSNVTRTLSTDVNHLHQEYSDLAALVVFSEYKVEQVLQIAKVGHVLPAGITRFVITGRVLRLNAELNFLKSSKSLGEKNQWLSQLLLEKLTKNKVRFYQEPVYLLDE